jgi:hypothetical protein
VKGLPPLSKLSWRRAEGSKLDEGKFLGFLRSEFSTIFGFRIFTFGIIRSGKFIAPVYTEIIIFPRI